MNRRMIAILLIIVALFTGCTNKKLYINKNTTKKNNSENNIKNIEKNKKEDEIQLDILVNSKLLYECVKSIDKGKHKADYIFKRQNGEVFIKYYYDLNYIPDLFIYDESNFSKYNDVYISKIEDNRVGIINASRGVNQLSYYKNINKYGSDHECLSWNNIDNYKVVLVNVKNAIVERDPKNRNYYEKNFNEVLSKLSDYEKVFKDGANKVKDCGFITQGNCLDYMMAYMGLKTISIDKGKEKNLDLDKLIEEKYNKIKDELVFIYYDDDFLEQYKDIILKYNMRCIKINKINSDTKYDELLEYEKKVLNTIVNICTK